MVDQELIDELLPGHTVNGAPIAGSPTPVPAATPAPPPAATGAASPLSITAVFRPFRHGLPIEEAVAVLRAWFGPEAGVVIHEKTTNWASGDTTRRTFRIEVVLPDPDLVDEAARRGEPAALTWRETKRMKTLEEAVISVITAPRHEWP